MGDMFEKSFLLLRTVVTQEKGSNYQNVEPLNELIICEGWQAQIAKVWGAAHSRSPFLFQKHLHEWNIDPQQAGVERIH